jgi:hypothetical protein
MDFDFNALSGSLPTELYLLTDLVQLDLNNNLLTGTVDQLGLLVDLEFLQLDGTYGATIEPISSLRFEINPSFQNLTISANDFTGTIPEEMGNLSLLRTFTIHNTFFSGTMPESVCALRDTNGGILRSLIAECDNIPGVGPQIECETPECCTDCRGL